MSKKTSKCHHRSNRKVGKTGVLRQETLPGSQLKGYSYTNASHQHLDFNTKSFSTKKIQQSKNGLCHYEKRRVEQYSHKQHFNTWTAFDLFDVLTLAALCYCLVTNKGLWVHYFCIISCIINGGPDQRPNVIRASDFHYVLVVLLWYLHRSTA